MAQPKEAPASAEILQLSLDKFEWKTKGRFDQLAELFDDDLVFIHLTGNSTTKAAWMNELTTRRFTYDRIDHKESAVRVYGDTAVLVGKAAFTVNGGSVYKLIYTEVYTRKGGKWKLTNLHTTSAQF